MTKIAGSGYESGSGSISQRHGSADPHPPQNVMDPQHCFFYSPIVSSSFQRASVQPYDVELLVINITVLLTV
jgi:hypothetical protein